MPEIDYQSAERLIITKGKYRLSHVHVITQKKPSHTFLLTEQELEPSPCWDMMAEVSEEARGLRVLSTGTSLAPGRSWLHSFFNRLDPRVLLLDRNPTESEKS